MMSMPTWLQRNCPFPSAASRGTIVPTFSGFGGASDTGGVAAVTWPAKRVTGLLAMTGAIVALIGNAIAPRLNGDDVAVYHRIARSGRFEMAGVIVLVAIVLVIAAFAGISRTAPVNVQGQLADYARLAVVVGGAVAVVQVAVELYGYRQQALAFHRANSFNVVGAFWATNALDHVNSALMATWTLVFLGLAPILLGTAQLRARFSGRLGLAAVVGGVVCAVVGFAELLKTDQSTFDIPFAIGSVIVTLWLLGTGVVLWRNPDPEAVV